jgi:chemotaxis signal transduction protein
MRNEYIRGIGKAAEEVVLLLDCEKLFGDGSELSNSSTL